MKRREEKKAEEKKRRERTSLFRANSAKKTPVDPSSLTLTLRRSRSQFKWASVSAETPESVSRPALKCTLIERGLPSWNTWASEGASFFSRSSVEMQERKSLSGDDRFSCDDVNFFVSSAGFFSCSCFVQVDLCEKRRDQLAKLFSQVWQTTSEEAAIRSSLQN